MPFHQGSVEAGGGWRSKLTDDRQTPRRVDGGMENWLLNLGRRSALELQACIADMVKGGIIRNSHLCLQY